MSHTVKAPNRPEPEATSAAQVLTPAVDILESDTALLVVADLPGVPKDAIKIDVAGRELTLEGRRAGESPIEYRRSFRLPLGVALDAITAEHKGGVLRLTLPKQSAQTTRQIPISVG